MDAINDALIRGLVVDGGTAFLASRNVLDTVNVRAAEKALGGPVIRSGYVDGFALYKRA